MTMSVSFPRVSYVTASFLLAAATIVAQTPKPKPKPPTTGGVTTATPSKPPYDGPATLLFQIDMPCRIWIDGTLAATAAENDVRPIKVSLGQHIVKVKSSDDTVSWERVITIERVEQRVVATALVAQKRDDAAARDQAAAEALEAEAQKTPRQKAQEVAQRAIVALGGLDAIRGIRTALLEFSSSTSGNKSLEAVQYLRRPGSARVELKTSSGKAVRVTVDGQSWMTLDDGPAEQGFTQSDQMFLDLYADVASGKETCEIGSANIQAVTLLCDGLFVRVFDPTSGLPRSNSIGGLTYAYSDYRMVQGFLWPFLWRHGEINDVYSRVEFNHELDPALFRRPQMPDAERR
jgi:hypothetical protein